MRSRIAGLVASVLLCGVITSARPEFAGAQQRAARIPAAAARPAAVVESSVTADDSIVLRYTPDDVAGVIALQPSRAWNSPLVQSTLNEAGGLDVMQAMFGDFVEQIHVNATDVTEFAVLVDADTIRVMHTEIEGAQGRVAEQNNVRMVGLAMHNFYSVYNQFPPFDGPGPVDDGRLSWRVHLLPYLEETALYEQFHLDEAWDSDHNKTLIEKMPDVFRTPGVEEAGKTSMHLIGGENTLFGDVEDPQFSDIPDGTSNTIMLAVAGADKADTWTKPGGLTCQRDDAWKTFGNINEELLVCMFDGSSQALATTLDADTIRRMIEPDDGEAIGYESLSPPDRGRRFVPGLVVHARVPLDQAAIVQEAANGLGEPRQEMLGTMKATAFQSAWIVFPDANTMLAGPEPLVRKMIATRKTAGSVRAELTQMYPANDLAGVAELNFLQEQLVELGAGIPMGNLVAKLQRVALSMDLAGSSDHMSRTSVSFSDANAANQLSALLQGSIQMQKANVMAAASEPGSPISEELAEMIAEIIDGTKVSVDGTTVSYSIPKPAEPQKFTVALGHALKPVFEIGRQQQEMARERRKTLSLRQIGLAMHNYHDVYNAFPRHDGDGRRDDGAQTGLSWRVHLLPFVDEGPLYEKFHLDEPWDSEHNKALIAEMPELYKVDGVGKPGYTALHVFVGMQTPFGHGRPCRIAEITDGTSNTLMVVQGGPDTADIWTKPGGLAFDPADPVTALGDVGAMVKVLFCDGATRVIEADRLSPLILSRLVQHQDGQVIPEF